MLRMISLPITKLPLWTTSSTAISVFTVFNEKLCSLIFRFRQRIVSLRKCTIHFNFQNHCFNSVQWEAAKPIPSVASGLGYSILLPCPQSIAFSPRPPPFMPLMLPLDIQYTRWRCSTCLYIWAGVSNNLAARGEYINIITRSYSRAQLVVA